MKTETFIFETKKFCLKNIINYPPLLSSEKVALKQNIMNLRKLKTFLYFYLNLCFLVKSSMDIE